MDRGSAEHPYIDDSDSELEFDVESGDNWSDHDTSSSDSSDSENDNNVEGVRVTNQGDRGGRGRGRGGKRRRVDHVNDEWGWKNVSEEYFVPNFGVNYEQNNAGTQVNTTNFSPIDFFKLYFPEQALELMVTETNRYAADHQNTATISEKSRKKTWADTDRIEMEAIIGLQMAMSMCIKPSIPEYWDTVFWINQTPYTKVKAARQRLLTQQTPPGTPSSSDAGN